MRNNVEVCLVTGAVGFIGFHLVTKLLKEGKKVIGIDNLNEYYDKNLKKARLSQLKNSDSNFTLHEFNINNSEKLSKLIKSEEVDCVFHLAAQAGVRHSLDKPWSHIENNIIGTINILESMRINNIDNLVFASSSSVYGLNDEMPFHEELNMLRN